MKTPKKPGYIRQADILANAIVNDDPRTMHIGELAPEIQVQIVTARMFGFHPVSVRWNTGEYALMLCKVGISTPSPEKILEAYYQCKRTNKTFPEGILT